MSNLKYRSDIDGLRAIAVLSVVVFHINKNWLPGGFVGVDIFFVISGFLITKIIYREISEGEFSFLTFYKRRIKRILPVFFLIVLVSTIISSLVMLPSDFLHFMKSVGSTLVFSSNMFFGYAVDYFSPNTEEYPLLHTWSLAVEEQYYILFPLVLLYFCKIFKTKDSLLLFLCITCFFSIVISCLLPYYPSWIKYNYYWLPSRAYELIVGSITAIATMDKKSSHENSWLMSVSGILMIILSVIFIKESNEFPGMLALIPCVGTALILSSGGRDASFVNKLLSLKLIVFIGLISYSLYLWHWPILAIMRYISNDGELSVIQIVIASCLMFSLSFLSWKFIETPVRKSNINFIKTVLIYYVLPSIILGTLVYGAIVTDGYPQRYGSKNEQMKQETTYMVTPFCHNIEIGNCVFGDLTKNPDTYMVGDSHAGHYSPMMDEIGKKEGFSFVAKTVDACYPLLDVNGQYPSKKEPFYTELCPKLIKKASTEYKKYKNIIFAGVWSEHFRLHPEMQMWLENQISTLTNEGHNVFIMEQVPMFKSATYDHAFRQRFSVVNISKITGNSSDMREFRVDVDRATNQLLKEITLKYKNAYFIEPMTSLGKVQNRKLPFFNGHLVYRDNGHLNEYGSRMIGNYVADKITAIRVINSSNHLR